jgi:hypothetical protein
LTGGASIVAAGVAKTAKQMRYIVAIVEKVLGRKVLGNQYTILFYAIVTAQKSSSPEVATHQFVT